MRRSSTVPPQINAGFSTCHHKTSASALPGDISVTAFYDGLKEIDVL
jgi:hypothetical protein